MSLVEERGPCAVRFELNKFKHVGGGGGRGDRFTGMSLYSVLLYGVLQCIMGNGHMGSPLNRMTATAENITFPQLCWHAVINCLLHRCSCRSGYDLHGRHHGHGYGAENGWVQKGESSLHTQNAHQHGGRAHQYQTQTPGMAFLSRLAFL